MKVCGKTGQVFDTTALLSFALIVVLSITGMFLLALSPRCWAWCLEVLDVRNWSPCIWAGVGGALFGILLLIRLWPEKGR